MSLPAGQMEAETAHAEETPDEPRRDIAGRSPSRIALDRLRSDKVALTCAIIVLFFVLVAIFAPLLTNLFGVAVDEGDPLRTTDAFGFPIIGPPDNGFTWEHPLGIEPQTGDDLLAEWIYGARTSVSVAAVATVLSVLIGVVVGLVAGFSRGWLDRVLTFVIDVFLSLPFLLVALVLAPIIVLRFRASPDALDTARFVALIGVLSFFTWMILARLIRGEVLSMREREFIESARVIGMPTRRILFKELLPNLIAPIVVAISLGMPAFVSAEAALAFLGVGVTGTPSWGQTITAAQNYFDTYPLYLYAPVVGVLVLVIALNLLGDAVRDAFDPKTRR